MLNWSKNFVQQTNRSIIANCSVKWQEVTPVPCKLLLHYFTIAESVLQLHTRSHTCAGPGNLARLKISFLFIETIFEVQFFFQPQNANATTFICCHWVNGVAQHFKQTMCWCFAITFALKYFLFHLNEHEKDATAVAAAALKQKLQISNYKSLRTTVNRNWK